MTSFGEWSEAVLGYTFKDPTLLDQALTHRSASSQHNERLEFLGDAVLSLVIASELYTARPSAREGSLSRFRSKLVRSETLAEIAAELNIGDRIQLGTGEVRTGGHQRRSVLANAVEAIFGAVLLDGGYSAATDVIRQVYASRLGNLPNERDLKDPKTHLQEWLQARQLPPPDYDLLDVSGAAHAQTFRVACRIPGLDQEAIGKGSSRRRAEQAAARSISKALQDEQ